VLLSLSSLGFLWGFLMVCCGVLGWSIGGYIGVDRRRSASIGGDRRLVRRRLASVFEKSRKIFTVANNYGAMLCDSAQK